MLKKNFDFKLPHFNERPKDSIIDTIVIHYTEKQNDVTWHESAQEIGVSAHYLINKHGIIFAVVPENLRAWHAGESEWRGKDNINNNSIGIELDNNGREEFASPLMNSLIQLCHELIKTHPIDKFNIVGHSDIAPNRKADPGKFFDWKLLAKNNIGIIPEEMEKSIPEIGKVQKMLSDYGYKIEITGLKDPQTINVMNAFNMHFNQDCTSQWNEKSQGALEQLLFMKGSS